jgi:acyl-homoserine lactone acylase PvdQ
MDQVRELYGDRLEDLAAYAASTQPYDAVIARDRFGIPHVHGASDADTAYGLAWAHAEDDFLTIQQSTLAARGRLATVAGRDAAPIDYLVALLRVREVTAAGYATLAPGTRALLEGYAAGLNAYAAAHPREVISPSCSRSRARTWSPRACRRPRCSTGSRWRSRRCSTPPPGGAGPRVAATDRSARPDGSRIERARGRADTHP